MNLCGLLSHTRTIVLGRDALENRPLEIGWASLLLDLPSESMGETLAISKVIHCALERDAIKSHWKLDEILGKKLMKTLLHHVAAQFILCAAGQSTYVFVTFQQGYSLCINDGVHKNKQFIQIVHCALGREALERHWKLGELLGDKLIETLLHQVTCAIKFQKGYSFIHFI